ncbi:hypothetical protein B0H14DRAFT_3788018 [Mycena olivaceomarginata]|nr:hypothetical protein B0H14DRAFT_3788018 [Mycena olivaceomarginata]
MEAYRGEGRGSYLWGRERLYTTSYRSVHNVRIERLWGHITAQIGATWADLFILLEMRHGLDINNTHHIWLLHYLFCAKSTSSSHRIEMRRGPGPNRSPADMFGFDMIVHGVRGSELPAADAASMSEEEMEVFGDDNILESSQENNDADEGSTSWTGRRGPPEHLKEVAVEPPSGPFSEAQMQILDAALLPFAGAVSDGDGAMLWMEALAAARRLRGDLF